jgi:cytochrome c553
LGVWLRTGSGSWLRTGPAMMLFPEIIHVRQGKGRLMNYVGNRLAMPLAILFILFSTTGFATNANAATASARDVQSKIAYCQDCHGPAGQGYSGVMPIPRIATQTTAYIANQLLDFSEARRDNQVSTDIPQIHGMSPAMRTALAAHFSGLNPEPLGDGPRNLVTKGKMIYEEGIPKANVPACSGCHGPEARGQDKIPRLAGQIYPYTLKELGNWTRERRQNSRNEDTSAVMTPVAHSLNQAQIAAIAAYLSYLK